jgi:hypothetical protein
MKHGGILEGITFLHKDESAMIYGGGPGPLKVYLKCVFNSLAVGEGAIRTGLLGAGLFGFARAIGVAAGCAGF